MTGGTARYDGYGNDALPFRVLRLRPYDERPKNATVTVLYCFLSVFLTPSGFDGPVWTV